jgi:hypothetical protein
MRKRSEVAQDSRQQDLPHTAPKPPESGPKTTTQIPEGFWVEQGTLFTRCPDCGLVQSTETGRKKLQEDGRVARQCVRCRGNIDPTFQVSAALLSHCEGMQSGGKKSPKPEAEKAPEGEGCAECGTRLTQTSIGVFCPRGCEQKPKAEEPKKETTKPKSAEERATAAEARQSTPLPAEKTTIKQEFKQEFKEADPDKVSRTMQESLRKVKDNVAPSSRNEPIDAYADTVTVTFGKETFCPVRDNFFGFGEFTMTTKVRPGETPLEAMRRLQSDLDIFAEEEFKRKLKGFTSRLDRAKEG